MDCIEHNGRRYYRVGGYYKRRDGYALHRVIWEEANGPVPEGHHVHHLDENRINNDLANLVCLPIEEHRRVHIGPKATEWHRSEAGRAWHRAHAIEQHINPTLIERVCERCGKTFSCYQSDRRYCTRYCAQKTRQQSTRYHEDRSCVICGKTFTVTFKYRPTKTCSRSCRQLHRWAVTGLRK